MEKQDPSYRQRKQLCNISIKERKNKEKKIYGFFHATDIERFAGPNMSLRF